MRCKRYIIICARVQKLYPEVYPNSCYVNVKFFSLQVIKMIDLSDYLISLHLSYQTDGSLSYPQEIPQDCWKIG